MSNLSHVDKRDLTTEPVHVHLSGGETIVCLVTINFTKALRHYSDSPEVAYKLLCDYANHAKLDDGALLDLKHVVKLNDFIRK